MNSKLGLNIVLSALAACLIFAIYFFVKNNLDYLANNPTEQTPVTGTELEIKDEISDLKISAEQTFYTDRNYDEGIKQYEEIVAKAGTLSADEEAWERLNLAGMHLRFNHEESYRIYSDVYNDESLSDSIRGKAILFAMWSFASSYNDRGMDLKFAQDKIFSQDRFGDVLPNGLILDGRTSVIQAVTYGLERSIELHPVPEENYLAYVLLANYLPSRFDWDFENPDMEVVERMKEHIRIAENHVYTAMDASENRYVYDPSVGTSLFYGLVRVNLFLNYAGLAEPEDFYKAVNTTLNYVSKFKGSHYNAIVFSAEATTQFIVANFMFNDMDPAKVDQERIRELLREHIYNLNDDDLSRRSFINSRGATPAQVAANHPDVEKWVLAYQRIFILLANEVDPEYKTFLLERNVPGWDEVNFDDPVWFEPTEYELDLVR